MKRIFLGIIGVVFTLFLVKTAIASSAQAYQDYLYQFDVYRQKYNEFDIAKNNYLKFNTLTAQQTAISTTKEMLAARAQLLRAYLLMLNEKITETPQMTQPEVDLYRALINGEVSFLDNQTQFVNSVQTLDDANNVSKQLESHYTVLQISMDQTILGITLAKLRGMGNEFSDKTVQAKALIDQVKPELSLNQQAILDRWFDQISNKRTLFLQKQDAISQAITGLKGSNTQNLADKFSQIQKQITDAESELTEGSSYLRELTNAMMYKN